MHSTDLRQPGPLYAEAPPPPGMPLTWSLSVPAQTSLQEALHEPHWKARHEIIHALDRSYYNPQRRAAIRLATCADSVRFYINLDSARVKPWIHRCCHRLCPFCAKHRGATVARKLTYLIRQMKTPRIIVLTVRHTDRPLPEQLADLRNWFARLRRRPFWRQAVTTGAYTLEIKYSPVTATWHPHLHIVYDGTYIPHAQLQHHWHEITQGSQIVWIEKLHNAAATANEFAKYIAKPARISRYPRARILEYAHAVTSTRMVQSFGRRIAPPLHDADPGNPDAPTTWQVSLQRITYLAAQGFAAPARLAVAIAARWPLFARYIYLDHPGLDPPEPPATRYARLVQAVHPSTGPPDPAARETIIRAQLDRDALTAFTAYRIEEEAGHYPD